MKFLSASATLVLALLVAGCERPVARASDGSDIDSHRVVTSPAAGHTGGTLEAHDDPHINHWASGLLAVSRHRDVLRRSHGDPPLGRVHQLALIKCGNAVKIS